MEFDDVHNPTRIYYDSPESVEALEFLQQLIHQDRVTPAPGEGGDSR